MRKSPVSRKLRRETGRTLLGELPADEDRGHVVDVGAGGTPAAAGLGDDDAPPGVCSRCFRAAPAMEQDKLSRSKGAVSPA